MSDTTHTKQEERKDTEERRSGLTTRRIPGSVGKVTQFTNGSWTIDARSKERRVNDIK